MQNALRNVLGIKTSSTHRDSTPGGIRRHAENVQKLKQLARSTFKFQFFEGPARAITSVII